MSFIYCQNPECGVYLGSLGGDQCSICGWSSGSTESSYAAPPTQAQAQELPELTSTVVNDACWKFVEAMPHQLPGPIFNDLKPAIYAALTHYHRAALAAKQERKPMTEGDV